MIAEFFTTRGMYVGRDFLDAELCARIRFEMQAATTRPATVWDGGANVVDRETRSTKVAVVSDDVRGLVHDRLREMKPALEAHFEVATAGYRQPEFLVYSEGDFFRPHADSLCGAGCHDETVTGRRVSVVLFLNREAEKPAPESYGGGALTFYGLMDHPCMKRYGFPLNGETGLLVAFRPEIVHAVAPVTHGQCFTIVSWLST